MSTKSLFSEKGLGRLYAPDERDEKYPLRALIGIAEAPPAEIRSRHWRTGPVLDQLDTPQCVGFAWYQFIASAPVMNRAKLAPPPHEIYRQAQLIDEWPGENYEGTSVRAGAKVLHAAGRITGYAWAENAATVRDFVLTRGPVVVGTNWYANMMQTKRGFIHPTGDNIGGHAYLVVGYSRDRRAFRILNSWGKFWGERGRAWIEFDEMEFLIQNHGEACSAIELGTKL